MIVDLQVVFHVATGQQHMAEYVAIFLSHHFRHRILEPGPGFYALVQRFGIAPVNGGDMRVIPERLIIIDLIPYPQRDQHNRQHADGKPAYIDKTEQFVPGKDTPLFQDFSRRF
jgi:hypothetical protein